MKVCSIFVILTLCESAKILSVFPHSGKSHHVAGMVLLKALAERGHEITIISQFPQENPVRNIKDIDVSEIHHDEYYFKKYGNMSYANLSGFLRTSRRESEQIFRNKDVATLMKSNQTFDLIILDYVNSQALFILGHIYKAPIILLSSYGVSVISNWLVGNPSPHAYTPMTALPYTPDMSFMERLKNMFKKTTLELALQYDTKNHEILLSKYFDKAPGISDLMDYVALILTNGHYSYEYPKPLVPNVIDIGGYHVEQPKKLSKDLQDYLDEATNGIIYFSLGTYTSIADLENKTINVILNVFSNFNCKVLLQYKDDNVLPNVPSNVKILKWVLQNDVLAHPNVKLFITHGGLLSIIEAIYHGVPIIGIPTTGDTKSNVPRAVNAGYGVQLNFVNITEESLTSAIETVLNNPQYKENILKHSDLLKDRPIKPLDEAIFWVEHVIKHKGANHLKNVSVKLTWYQYLLLDIIGFLLVVFLIVLLIFYIILRKCIKVVLRLKKYKDE